jgi:toxin secretion/phage lysis holin
MQATLYNAERQGLWAVPWKSIPWGFLVGAIMLTWATWFLNNTPQIAQTQTLIVLGMLLTDSLTGVIAAGLARKISSHRMRTRFIAKCAQYSCLVVLSAAPALLLKNWLPIECALTALIAFEAVSIVENMRRLESLGGVNLGPARPLIGWLSKFLDVPDPNQCPAPGLIITPQEAAKEQVKPVEHL